MEKGYVVYEGKSELDGKPIVSVMTVKSVNKKTGDIPQVWIMRSDVNPVESSKLGDDVSICGVCPHRHFLNGVCYVNIGQAPLSVWKTYRKGKYSVDFTAAHFRAAGNTIRIGAYGDPAAVPMHVWDNLIGRSTVIGYTHQWRLFPGLKKYCQASVDSLSEQVIASSEGWKTFRVASDAGNKFSVETECLSVTKNMTCKQCKMCNGRRGHVVIQVHGSRSKNF
jgi:hypothetical protein